MWTDARRRGEKFPASMSIDATIGCLPSLLPVQRIGAAGGSRFASRNRDAAMRFCHAILRRALFSSMPSTSSASADRLVALCFVPALALGHAPFLPRSNNHEQIERWVSRLSCLLC